jgi:predicted ATPase
MSMQLVSLRLKNFRAFKEVEFKDLPRFCVFVGANGTGKSTIFQVFSFLQDALRENVTSALIKLGGNRGFKEVHSRGTKGPIEIELKFRAKASGPLITYFLAIDEKNDEPVVANEELRYRRGPSGKPWNFLKFNCGVGAAVTNEWEDFDDETKLDREDQTLKAPDILAIKALAQFEKFPATRSLGELIENWHVSDFHIQKARGESASGAAEHLARQGDNLAQVAYNIHKRHPTVFHKILKALKRRVPGLDEVEAILTDYGRVLLRFRDGAFQDPFLSDFVSDGTIKMFAYLLLLHDPNPHPLLGVEEPENQLYPDLLAELAEEFRAYAQRGGQVMVSTHSPNFLNAVKLEEVFWLVKKNGYTTAHRAKEDKQIKAYMEEGDQMGRLWLQGLFEGADPA